LPVTQNIQPNGPIKIHVTGKSAYPGDYPNSYVLTTEPKTNLLQKVVGSIGSVFMALLPDRGAKATTTDTSLVVKTSPTIWEYEQFRLEWDRRTVLRDIDMILNEDPRIKRANRVFAATAIRKGITVTVSSTVSDELAEKAQDVINQVVRDAQINAKLASWARILLQEGDLFLNPVIDVETKRIKTIKRLPAISMQRNDDMMGSFQDLDAAFRQIDPISLAIIDNFPLWAVNHIRYDHQEGDRYGNSQYLQIRGYWKKLKMTEEDLVIRRRTRAIPRRLHTVGNKDNPGGWADVQNYKAANHLDAKTSQITTDYYGNGLTDIKNLDGDAHLDHIKDIEHLQEIYMIGTGVPLHMIGFGRNVNRDIVEDQIKQFKLDTQELRDLLEYGDSSPYSGLRFIFDFALALQGIDPGAVDYNIGWYADDNETASDRVSRVIALRAAQPKPLISQQSAVQIIARDINLDNADAINAEIDAIEAELGEDRADQAALEEEVNAENPSTAPLSRAAVSRALRDAVESRKKKVSALYSMEVDTLERRMAADLREHGARVLKAAKPAITTALRKWRKQTDEQSRGILVDHIVEAVEGALANRRDEKRAMFVRYYDEIGGFARQRVSVDARHAITDDVGDEEDESGGAYLPAVIQRPRSSGGGGGSRPPQTDILFTNPEVQRYFERQAGLRVVQIDAFTLRQLRLTLTRAYEQLETPAQWYERIEAVVDCSLYEGRAEAIARTELAWAYNNQLINGYAEIGIDRVQLLAVIDNRTCEDCLEAHEKIFTLAEAESIAPRHPRCRCTFIGVWDEHRKR
jgi:SPP1 gp7 family putative phage head morphogenesis protein